MRFSGRKPWSVRVNWLRTILIHTAVVAALFSPILTRGLLLAPDDGVGYFIPAFLSPSPIWDPALFCGFPAHADPQSMLWYPLRHLPGGLAAWNVFILSGFVLAGAFFHRWIAQRTGSELAGFASGVLFACSGYPLAHLRHANVLHTAAWVPLVLFCIDRLREAPSPRRIAALAAAFAMTILAGHPQTFVYFAIAISIDVVGGGKRNPAVGLRRHLGAVSLGLVLGIAAASVLILPMIELASRSSRGAHGIDDPRPHQLLAADLLRSVVSPAFRGGASSTDAKGIATEAFVGVTGAALAMFALARGRRRELALAGAALLAIVLAFGNANFVGRLVAQLPGFDLFRVSARFLAVAHLALAALAGIGIARLGKTPARVAAALLFAEAMSFAWFGEWRTHGVPPSEFEKPAFLESARAELAQTGQRLAPFSGRLGEKDAAPVNRSALWGIASCTGYNPLVTGDAVELLGIDRLSQIPSELFVGPHLGVDLAAVRFLTTPDDWPEYVAALVETGRWKEVSRTAGAVLLERTAPLPRAWLAPQVVHETRGEILRTIRQGTDAAGAPFDPRRVAFVESTQPFPALTDGSAADSSSGAMAVLDTVDLEFNGLRLERVRTRSAGARLLVISDSWDPGWRVRVDGKPAELLRCDFLFLGVPLPSGAHDVELAYRPRSLLVGGAISVVALLVLLALAVAPASLTGTKRTRR